MEERVSTADPGEERRRRWPGECPGEERRQDALIIFETDQEPDQSPLAELPPTAATPLPPAP